MNIKNKVSEGLSLLFFLTGLEIAFIYIPALPDRIPNHFNLSGEPNGYGSKYTVFVGPGVALFLYMLLGLLSVFPEYYNYPGEKKDKEAQYKLGAELIRNMKMWLMIFLAALTYEIAESAKTGVSKHSLLLIAFILLIVSGNLLFFALKWRKLE